MHKSTSGKINLLTFTSTTILLVLLYLFRLIEFSFIRDSIGFTDELYEIISHILMGNYCIIIVLLFMYINTLLNDYSNNFSVFTIVCFVLFSYFFLIDYKIENNYDLIFLLLSLCSYIVDNYRKFYTYRHPLFYTILTISVIECIIAIVILLFNLFYDLKLIDFYIKLDNPIWLSSLLVFTLPFDLYLCKHKKIIFILISIKIILIILYFSRTSILAVLAIIFIHYCIYKKMINWNKVKKYIWVFILPVLLFYYFII